MVEPGSGALVVRDQSGFAGILGFKNGDRVESANGVALAVPADIPAMVLQPLTRSQPVWLAGTRDGKPQHWLYLNAGAVSRLIAARSVPSAQSALRRRAIDAARAASREAPGGFDRAVGRPARGLLVGAK